MPHTRIQAVAVAALTALVVGVVPGGAFQSPPLGEVARKERERRKTAKPAGKAYTNKDLPESARVKEADPAAPAAAAPVPSPAPAAAPPPAPAEPEKDEAWWRARIAAAREELRRNEVFAEALQTRVNALSSDFVNRDDPFQRAKIGEDRDKAVAELGRVKGEIERGRKQIEDIEEEARKAGVPPGWVR